MHMVQMSDFHATENRFYDTSQKRFIVQKLTSYELIYTLHQVHTRLIGDAVNVFNLLKPSGNFTYDQV
jgi:hypothetical protein